MVQVGIINKCYKGYKMYLLYQNSITVCRCRCGGRVGGGGVRRKDRSGGRKKGFI